MEAANTLAAHADIGKYHIDIYRPCPRWAWQVFIVKGGRKVLHQGEEDSLDLAKEAACGELRKTPTEVIWRPIG